MLRTDVGVIELPSLSHGEFEDLLRTGRIRQFAERDRCLALSDRFFDALVNLLQVHAEVLEHGGGDALPFTNQAEQNVLGTHVVVLKTDGLFSGHRQNLPDSVGKIVVHDPSGLVGRTIVGGLFGDSRDVSLCGQGRDARMWRGVRRAPQEINRGQLPDQGAPAA